MKDYLLNLFGVTKTGKYFRQEFEKIKMLNALPLVFNIKNISKPVFNK